MAHKWLAISIIFGGIFVLIGAVLAINSFRMSPGSQTTLEECNVLGSAEKGAVNILFFADKKNSEKYREYFLKSSPFSDNKKAFNFYYVESYSPICDLYKNMALFCHSSELIKKASSCPSDYIVVLENKDSSIRSSAYLNVLSLNTHHPFSVLLHEFGHAFATLAEEYNPAPLSSGSKNCVKDCKSFEGLEEGCYQGCSKNEYYRSIENGVMRTLNSDKFGKFDEYLLTRSIGKQSSSHITGNVVEGLSCNQKYYLIVGNYSNGNITVIKKTLETGCLGGNGNGPFVYSLLDSQNRALQDSSFNPEIIFTDSPEGSEAFLYEGEFTLRLPVINEASSLKVTKDGKDVPMYSMDEESLLPRFSPSRPYVFLGDIGARVCKIS